MWKRKYENQIIKFGKKTKIKKLQQEMYILIGLQMFLLEPKGIPEEQKELIIENSKEMIKIEEGHNKFIEEIYINKLKEHNNSIIKRIKNKINDFKELKEFYKEVLKMEKDETIKMFSLILKLNKKEEEKKFIKEQIIDIIKMMETIIVAGAIPGGATIHFIINKLLIKIKEDFTLNVSSIKKLKEAKKQKVIYKNL